MYKLAVTIISSIILAGCAAPVVETKVIEKPVPVFCEFRLPDECKDAYAVDRVSPKDTPLTLNRALRAEIEERTACELKLRAGLRGCGK